MCISWGVENCTKPISKVSWKPRKCKNQSVHQIIWYDNMTVLVEIDGHNRWKKNCLEIRKKWTGLIHMYIRKRNMCSVIQNSIKILRISKTWLKWLKLLHYTFYHKALMRAHLRLVCARACTDHYENFFGCQLIFNELKFQISLRSDHSLLRYTWFGN